MASLIPRANPLSSHRTDDGCNGRDGLDLLFGGLIAAYNIYLPDTSDT